MTIEENITVVPRMLGWDKARCKRRAEELMDMVALDPKKFLHRYPKEMSGGQQQRIGVMAIAAVIGAGGLGLLLLNASAAAIFAC